MLRWLLTCAPREWNTHVTTGSSVTILATDNRDDGAMMLHRALAQEHQRQLRELQPLRKSMDAQMQTTDGSKPLTAQPELETSSWPRPPNATWPN